MVGVERIQPTLFIGHGSPMLALEGGEWHAAMAACARGLAPVQAVVVVSAHWETSGSFRVTSSPRPGILHDFSGFPEDLYRLTYDAQGNPDLAKQIADLLISAGLEGEADPHRPLDHGAWVPLRALFPAAQLPVLQVSLPRPRSTELLVRAGQALAPLRKEGILLIGSGGLVHNLRRLLPDGPAELWAKSFEEWLMSRLRDRDLPSLLRARKDAPDYAQAVPTSEHLDPLYFALGAAGSDSLSTIFEGWQHGNLSLRALAWGAASS